MILADEDWEPPPQLNRCHRRNSTSSGEQVELFVTEESASRSTSPREVSAIASFLPNAPTLVTTLAFEEYSTDHNGTTQNQSPSNHYLLLHPNNSEIMKPKSYTPPIAAASYLYDRFDLAELQMALPHEISPPTTIVTHSSTERMNNDHATITMEYLNGNFNDTSYEYIPDSRDDDTSTVSSMMSSSSTCSASTKMIQEEESSAFCTFWNVFTSFAEATNQADTCLVDVLTDFADQPTRSTALDVHGGGGIDCDKRDESWEQYSSSSLGYDTGFGFTGNLDYPEKDWAELEYRGCTSFIGEESTNRMEFMRCSK